MTIKRVEGNEIIGIGYALETVHVRKKDGSLHAYNNVPSSIGLRFKNSDNPDEFFYEHIDGRYPTHRVS